MADHQTKSAAARRKAAEAKADSEQAEQLSTAPDGAEEEQAATDAAAPPEPPTGDPEQAEPDASDNVPPLPPEAAPLAADGPQVDPAAEFSVARLAARAPELLGCSPAVAQGVLAEGEDPITFAAAKQAIQEYLDGPVANTETEEA